MTTLNRRELLHAGTLAAVGFAANAHPANADTVNSKTPKYHLGLVTYNLAAAWNLDQLLDVCKNTGVSPVEFRTTHKHGVEPSLTKEQRSEVKKKCADAGVAIWGCGTVCEFQSEDAAVVKKNIETCKEFVQLVADLGGRGVKVRPNGRPKNVAIEKTLEQIGKALIPCGKAADDAGIEIWVEVHGPETAHPPHMKTIMQHCNHPKVGVTWNSNKEDIVDGSVEKYFKLLQPWIKSCHINELYKDAAGVYPYRELFRLFRESGYDRVTLCEVGRTVADPEMGKEMLRYYKALWTELARG
jgi:sugar phosphate isomerase/epimerase